MRKITVGDAMHVYGGFGEKVDYTDRVSLRLSDPVDADVLSNALDKTRRRYPYLCVRLRKNEKEYYYEDNPLPVPMFNCNDRITLNCSGSNYHLWAVCWYDDHIHLDCYHGLTDGTGVYALLSTLLYYYCNEKYGLTDHQGIRTLEDAILPEETADPQEELAPMEPVQDAADPEPAFTLGTDGGLTPSEATLWDIEIPEDDFIRFTSANDASPGTMVSLMFARAIDSLYPSRDKKLVSAYVINARPMLKDTLTYHNCLSAALLDYSDRIKALPFTTQCTAYRGKTFIQSDDDRICRTMAVNAGYIKTALENAESLEEKKAIFGKMFGAGEGYVSFLVSYIGKWKFEKIGKYILELWAHPPNTFDMLVEIGTAGGKIFLTVQQRFLEDTVREAFLRQLDENGISYSLKRVMKSDVPVIPEPQYDN